MGGPRSEAPSSLFAYLGNTLQLNHRLNNGIFTVHRFSVAAPARLHQSECVFRFYVYGGIFNPPGTQAVNAKTISENEPPHQRSTHKGAIWSIEVKDDT
jgi:hypothetical protein